MYRPVATTLAAAVAVVAVAVLAQASVATAVARVVHGSPAPTTIPRPGYCGDAYPIPPLSPSTDATLLQAQIIVRHGDRTPAFNHMCWAGNTAVWTCNMTQLQLSSMTPWDTTTQPPRLFRKQFEPGAEVLPTGNCGLGQLTTVGLQQQYNNGMYLRQAYVDRLGFLPPSWLDDPDDFHLRSDDVLRTLQSAQALFEGLYPPQTDKLATKQVVGVPVVPFYVEDIDTDTMTYNPTRCPALNSLTATIQNTTEFTNHIKTVTTPLAERASKAFGIPVPPVGWSNGGLNTKLDCLMTHRCHDFALPDTVTEELFDAIVEEDTWQYGYQLNYTGFVRLAVGTFMGELLANAEAMVAKHTAATTAASDASRTPAPPRQARRFWLYAGHDDGPIMPMMRALGAFHGVWSPYATLIALELYNSSSPTPDEPADVPTASSASAALRGAADAMMGTIEAATAAARAVAGGSPVSGAHAEATEYFFVRAIVLGQVVQMPGCSSTLCPLSQFRALVESLVPTAAECAGEST